jgi:hypothetical protein
VSPQTDEQAYLRRARGENRPARTTGVMPVLLPFPVARTSSPVTVGVHPRVRPGLDGHAGPPLRAAVAEDPLHSKTRRER